MTLYVSGQKYYSLPESGAVWSVNENKFSVAGDTVIAGITYKKYFITVGDSVFSFDKASYYAALREDTSRKVWIIRRDSIIEKLLYDFSLKIGDTTTVNPIGPFGLGKKSFKIKISQVDSIRINLLYHKRYKIISINDFGLMPEYWTEGIGSSMGLFNSGVSTLGIADYGYPELLCFTYNNTITYFGGSSDCYRPLAGDVKVGGIEKFICSFNPNPFSDNSMFHIIGVDNFNFTLEIYSIQGELVKTYRISQNESRINRIGISSGVYLFKLLDKKLVRGTGKIIIK